MTFTNSVVISNKITISITSNHNKYRELQ